MMFNLKNIFYNLEKQTKIIIKNGVKFCFLLCLVSLCVLLTYILAIDIPILFDIGIILFKMSLLFGVEFLICGIVVDSLKKNLI